MNWIMSALLVLVCAPQIISMNTDHSDIECPICFHDQMPQQHFITLSCCKQSICQTCIGSIRCYAAKQSITSSLCPSCGTDITALLTKLTTQLCDAVQNEDILLVTQTLQSGADPNQSVFQGTTPLHNAAQIGHLQIAELLLISGANTDSQDHTGDTPLHKAAQHGHEQIAVLLLVSGANQNTENNKHLTPLQYAVTSGHSNIVKLLIENGTCVNALDHYGRSPLYYARHNNHEPQIDKCDSCIHYAAIVQLLQNHGGEDIDMPLWRRCCSIM